MQKRQGQGKKGKEDGKKMTFQPKNIDNYFNVNATNMTIKSQKISNQILKNNPSICCLSVTNQYKGRDKPKVKWYK